MIDAAFSLESLSRALGCTVTSFDTVPFSNEGFSSTLQRVRINGAPHDPPLLLKTYEGAGGREREVALLTEPRWAEALRGLAPRGFLGARHETGYTVLMEEIVGGEVRLGKNLTDECVARIFRAAAALHALRWNDDRLLDNPALKNSLTA